MNKDMLVIQKNRALNEVFILRKMILVLGVICLSLIPIIYHLLMNSKTHIVPAVVKDDFWISSGSADEKYLIQMAEFWGGMLLTANSTNYEFRKHHLLDHVDPNNFSSMKRMLSDQEERIKGGLSSSFSSNKFKVDASKMLVEVTGILHLYEGGRSVSSDEAKFKIGFSISNGRVFVKSFEEINHG